MAKSKSETSKPKRNRRGASARRRGHAYETQICKELNEIGFDCVTSRSESKSTDDNKIDIIDKSNKLPCYIQIKRTQTTPQYFKIRSESTVPKNKFAIMWNKQVAKEVNICSDGECVIMDKQLFYELIKPYADS